MEKINILEPFADRETGKPYYPGVHEVGEDIPDSTASRAVGSGLAEVLDEAPAEEASAEEAPEEAPASPEEPAQDLPVDHGGQ